LFSLAVVIDCAPGTVSTGGNTTCTVCPAGKYCPNTDGTGIGSCLPGQYSLPGGCQRCCETNVLFCCPLLHNIWGSAPYNHLFNISLHLYIIHFGAPPWFNWPQGWITDHYHLSSNLGVGISEVCLIFDFASLLLEVARSI